VEGLVIVQRVIMQLWDKILEPTLALHLHNMLVKQGYLKKEVGLYTTLKDLFQDSFFPNGVPTDGFLADLLAQTARGRNDRTSLLRQRQAVSRDVTSDVHQLLNPDFNRFFRAKSDLMMYYDADWVHEKNPDSVVRIPTVLYMNRLMETERVVDLITGEKRLVETEPVKRAKARGQTDAALLEAASIPLPDTDVDDEEAKAYMDRIAELKDYKTGPRRNPYQVLEQKKRGQWQGRSLLELLRLDIFADFCGNHPVSSLNLVWITCHVMLLFMKFEDEFRKARHPLWVEAYEHPQPQLRGQKRLALVMAVMTEEDDQTLKIFAEGFESLRLGALACIFWEDLREEESGMKPRGDDDKIPMDQCSVM
jgi:hypothetical protein